MMKKSNREQQTARPTLDFAEPLKLENHKRPVTRRDFLGQGLIAGGAAVIAPTLLGVLGPQAYAAVTQADCGILGGAGGSGKVPFLAVDLSGGANIAGSNVLVGGMGGQRDFLSTAGYEKLGLPATMLPSLAGQIDTLDAGGLGLAFHADSALLAGIRDVATQTTLDKVNGSIMCARSSNDTSDNPHNPMYGIYKAGADGDIVSLIGSRSSDSGGRSAAPASMIDLSVRPTKISSGNDARGLVDTGKLAKLLPDGDDAVNVMRAMQRISEKKLAKIQEAAALKQLMECGYLESALAAAGDPNRTDIDADTVLQTVFTNRNLDINDFQKTAAVSKLVINGLAGAGTVQFGGYDYHNSTRTTGDSRDRKAGQEIGAALEYASLMGKPLMIYVFSDGSVASDGNIDSTGKGIWKGDNSSTASSLMLVFDPAGLPQIANNNNQLGFFRATGSIETSASVISNNVDQLAEAVVLNYMALNGDVGRFSQVLPNHGLGALAADLDALTAFQPIA
ncbi:MAG: twin-arginine translocation signal domain-containing protein [Thiohalomonadales bacterium]